MSANARRVASFRARQRASLGEEAYKRQQSAQRAERRRRQRESQRQANPQPTDAPEYKQKGDIQKVRSAENCDELFELVLKAKTQWAKENNKKITKSSVKTQFNRVKNIYKRVFDKKMDCTDYEWVKDTKKVIEFIQSGKRWKTKASQNAQFSALASVLSVLDGYEREYQIYSEISTAGAKIIKETASEIKMSDKERKNFVNWSILGNLYKKKQSNLEHKALVSLTTILPPRRNQDYQYLTLTNSRNGIKKDLNYLLLDSDGMPTTLIYNRYKTAKTFGTQEFDIPSELARILKQYIEDYEIEVNEPLFYVKKGDTVSYYANFTDKITEAFRSYIKKDITVNILRHSKIHNFLLSKKTPKEKNQLALAMGHSVSTQALYDRIL